MKWLTTSKQFRVDTRTYINSMVEWGAYYQEFANMA